MIQWCWPIEGSAEYAGGYDVEIAKLIAEGLGKRLVIVKTKWDGLVPALLSGKLMNYRRYVPQQSVWRRLIFQIITTNQIL